MSEITVDTGDVLRLAGKLDGLASGLSEPERALLGGLLVVATQPLAGPDGGSEVSGFGVEFEDSWRSSFMLSLPDPKLSSSAQLRVLLSRPVGPVIPGIEGSPIGTAG
jgi:hypothetical protein